MLLPQQPLISGRKRAPHRSLMTQLLLSKPLLSLVRYWRFTTRHKISSRSLPSTTASRIGLSIFFWNPVFQRSEKAQHLFSMTSLLITQGWGAALFLTFLSAHQDNETDLITFFLNLLSPYLNDITKYSDSSEQFFQFLENLFLLVLSTQWKSF